MPESSAMPVVTAWCRQPAFEVHRVAVDLLD
jgi:hypothetical protein